MHVVQSVGYWVVDLNATFDPYYRSYCNRPVEVLSDTEAESLEGEVEGEVRLRLYPDIVVYKNLETS